LFYRVGCRTVSVRDNVELFAAAVDVAETLRADEPAGVPALVFVG
jgi:hypothetical protein